MVATDRPPEAGKGDVAEAVIGCCAMTTGMDEMQMISARVKDRSFDIFAQSITSAGSRLRKIAQVAVHAPSVTYTWLDQRQTFTRD